jgi:signal transduction histidine kinase
LDDCAVGECTHYAEVVRLRRDLHDGLGPGLAGIMMRADVLARMMTDDQGVAEEMLRDLRREAATFMTEFRRVLADREPAELEDRALADGVVTLARRMTSASGATMTVDVEVADDVDELDRDVQVAGFWIVKEALTNVVKHACATRCAVRLWVDDGLRLSVVDNGTGAGPGLVSGVGLSSMGGRAAEFGGWCDVSDVGGGVSVTAHLPEGWDSDDRAA